MGVTLWQFVAQQQNTDTDGDEGVLCRKVLLEGNVWVKNMGRMETRQREQPWRGLEGEEGQSCPWK